METQYINPSLSAIGNYDPIIGELVPDQSSFSFLSNYPISNQSIFEGDNPPTLASYYDAYIFNELSNTNYSSGVSTGNDVFHPTSNSAKLIGGFATGNLEDSNYIFGAYNFGSGFGGGNIAISLDALPAGNPSYYPLNFPSRINNGSSIFVSNEIGGEIEVYIVELGMSGSGIYNGAQFVNQAEADLYLQTTNNRFIKSVIVKNNYYYICQMEGNDNINLLRINPKPFGGGFDFIKYQVQIPELDLTDFYMSGCDENNFYLSNSFGDAIIKLKYDGQSFQFLTVNLIDPVNDFIDSVSSIGSLNPYIIYGDVSDLYFGTLQLAGLINSSNSLRIADVKKLPCYVPCQHYAIKEY